MGILRSMFDGQYGLVTSNLRVYVKDRGAGLPHSVALATMIETRYRLTPDKMQHFVGLLDGGGSDPESDLRTVLTVMYGVETDHRFSGDFHDQMRLMDCMEEVIAKERERNPGLF